jgi:hypothetical protein
MGLSSRYEIVRSNHPSLKVTKKGTIQVFGSDSGKSVWTGTITGPNEIENEFKRCKEILEYSCETLWGAIGYYTLALAGADQLVTAGNLYMAMEEVFVAVMFRKGLDSWKKVLMELLPYRPESPKSDEAWIDECDKIGDDLQHGRHAWFKPHKGANKGEWIKSEQLDNKNLVVCNQVVREIILAYVEWLKANK